MPTTTQSTTSHTATAMPATPPPLCLSHHHRCACHTTTAVPATPPPLCLPHQHRCACHTTTALSATPPPPCLPHHHRCACHTLQLIATTDANRTEESANYKKVSSAAFAKCQSLWNKSSRSMLSAEVVQANCGMARVKPNQTRWNSVYMAVERIVRIVNEKGEESLHSLCNELKLPR